MSALFGPSIVPWGTPEVTGDTLDLVLLNFPGPCFQIPPDSPVVMAGYPVRSEFLHEVFKWDGVK